MFKIKEVKVYKRKLLEKIDKWEDKQYGDETILEMIKKYLK